MTFGTTQFKNGKRWGRLTFATGKVVILKPIELAEFEAEIRYYEQCAKEKIELATNN